MVNTSPPEKRRIYGRRLGRPLNPARQNALDELYSVLKVPDDIFETNHAIDPRDLYPKSDGRLICEIGFGDGDHLAEMMKRAPQDLFIGAEPYINGMSSFLKQIKDEELSQNQVRVWMDDAIRLLEKFTNQSLDEIYILNPDPWPKARHHKRRIVNSYNLDLFGRLLKPGGQLIMTTDVNDLAEWMVTQTNNHHAFLWTASSKKDWAKPPEGWIATKYEKKGLEAGRQQTYLIFKRT